MAWPRVQRKEQPEAYVRRAMLTTATNRWRRRRVLRELPSSGAMPERPEPRSATDEFDDRDRVWAALRTLPPRQRAVLVLRYYDDLSEAAIAEQLGIRPGTVKSQAAKALAALRTATGLLHQPEAAR